MKTRRWYLLSFLFLLLGVPLSGQQTIRFDKSKDLLLAHFDCKTDVDDLHSAAALASLMRHPDYANIRYHAVAGAYGMQNGLYVPPNPLFEIAFKDQWSDAHASREQALKEVTAIALKALERQGDIWISDAGQSDFSAALIRELRRRQPALDTRRRIHIVQHSTWNEDVTTPADLTYVKAQAEYHKIPDGNTVGNGSPGFRSAAPIDLSEYITDPEILKTWEMAKTLGLKYNGAENRYYNKAIGEGGLDFSDLSEVCWILGLENLRDAGDFFSLLKKP